MPKALSRISGTIQETPQHCQMTDKSPWNLVLLLPPPSDNSEIRKGVGIRRDRVVQEARGWGACMRHHVSKGCLGLWERGQQSSQSPHRAAMNGG